MHRYVTKYVSEIEKLNIEYMIDIHDSSYQKITIKGRTFRYRRSYVPLLLLILTYVSVNQWSTVKIGNTATTWLLEFVILYCLWQEKRINKLSLFEKPYFIVGIYLCWAVIGILRGCYVAENYWEYKALIRCSLITLFPICVYAFANPLLLQHTLRFWVSYALPSILLPIFWNTGWTQFYLGPVYLMICFVPIIKDKKWKWILVAIALFLATDNIQENRSQFVKAIMSLALCLAAWKKILIADSILKLIHWSYYLLTVILLWLGITGVFNVFNSTFERFGGQYVSSNVQQSDMADDSRSFIYEEVIGSAVRNNYVLFGRTQARGNDAVFFYDDIDDALWTKRVKNFKHERSMNELCFPNIFTWLGLVGMFVYIGIYLTASFLGMYRSNNYYVKLLSLYVAFNFLYGWVENCTNFDIINFNYWMMNAICLSSRFRTMTNSEFVIWVRGIFPKF